MLPNNNPIHTQNAAAMVLHSQLAAEVDGVQATSCTAIVLSKSVTPSKTPLEVATAGAKAV